MSRVLLVSLLVALVAIASAVSLSKGPLQPALIETEGDDETEEAKYILNAENSHEPLYKEMSTKQKEEVLASQEPGPPVMLPYGTKISVPGLPPGSRINPGGVTPLQRAFDKRIELKELKEAEVDEEAELSAERTLEENPNAQVGDAITGNVHKNAEEKAEAAAGACEDADCEKALKTLDTLSEKMDSGIDAVGNAETTSEEGYGYETHEAAAETDSGYGETAEAAAPAAEAAAPAADEGYGYGAAAAPAGDEGYGAEAAAPPAEGYGEEAAAEGYGNTETAAAEGDGYGAAAAPAGDEGYGAETAAAGTEAPAAAAAADEGYGGEEGYGAAGAVDFLEISSTFTPESLKHRIKHVDAPLPKLLHE